MTLKPGWRRSAIALTSLAFLPFSVMAETQNTGSVMAEMSDPAIIAKHKQIARDNIHCPPVPEEDLEAQYLSLSKMKWDRAQMACGLQYGARLAADEWWNPELQLTVLGAHIEYFDVLLLSYNSFYQGIERSSELAVRWEMTKQAAEEILWRTDWIEWLLPEATLLRVAYLLSSTQKEADQSEIDAALDLALAELPVLAEESPEIIDGLGLGIYGTVLLSLPEFAGGDSLIGIEMLEKSIAINPNNLSHWANLVEGYLGERENDKALSALQKAIQVNPDTQNPQDYADYMKHLGGMAVRAGDIALSKAYGAAREKTLNAHPMLLARKQTAAFGHGGENPITGEDASKL